MRKSEQLAFFQSPDWPPPRVRPKRPGAGVLLVAADTGRILLAFRAAWLQDGCTWSTPGGLVDFHEAPAAAAVRELWEELGINLLSHSTDLKHTHESEHSGRRYTTFVVEVETETEFDVDVDQYETLAAEWFDLEDAAEEDLHPGLRASLEDLGLLARSEFTPE
jgi:8-oxo-dGTP pyrophosphatase MutT (NUDIX family)